jgi:uncharacterized protein
VAGDSHTIEPTHDPTRPEAGPPAPAGSRRSAGRRERRLFLGAVAAIVLFAVFDAFVGIAPGAGRSSHIARAAVPIAVAALAAWSYSRQRAGVRACVCLVFGVLALAAGALSVTGAGASGANAADWIGCLMIPAGLALLSLGLWLLWTSRKRSGRRYLRRPLLGAVTLLVVFWFVLPVGLALVATHRARTTIAVADLGRPYETVSLTTKDGLRLAGWYVPSQNGAAVITFPREWTVAHARMLVRHGYGVLLLDMRGYGQSQGETNAFGWGAAADVDAAVAFLQRRPDVRDGRIGGLGLSVGGEQMLEAAAGDPGLRAVVSEGAGERSVRETLLYGPAAFLSIPMALTQSTALAVLTGTAPPPQLKELTARIAPRAVLLIYARHGQGGEDLNPQYFAAAGEPKSLWEITSGSHTGGIRARPAEYERRVIGFFDRTLLPAD